MLIYSRYEITFIISQLNNYCVGMNNDDILNEIRKLKEDNLRVQNHLAELEAKILNGNQNNTYFSKKSENRNYISKESNNSQFYKPFKSEKYHEKTLESNTDVFDLQKFEIIDELYKRSRKHLKNFQKKCDTLLTQANTNAKVAKGKSNQKNDYLYNLYLNNFLDEESYFKNKSNSKGDYFSDNPTVHQKESRHVHKHSKHTSRNTKFDDYSDKSYAVLGLTKRRRRESINNFEYQKKPKNQNYRQNIDFYRKYKLNSNDSESVSSLKSHSFDSPSSRKKNYDKNELFSPNTTDSIDDSDDIHFLGNVYLNPQDFNNNIQMNAFNSIQPNTFNNIQPNTFNNIQPDAFNNPYQYQYMPQINQGFPNLQQTQNIFSDKLSDNSKNSNTSLSKYSATSTITSSLNSDSSYSDDSDD